MIFHLNEKKKRNKLKILKIVVIQEFITSGADECSNEDL